MKRPQRPFILRLINALFTHDPTIPPTKRAAIEKQRKTTRRRRTRKRKPKEPKP